MRLIDADALDISGADFKNYDDYSHYIDLITNAPTIEERKHGHWERRDMDIVEHPLHCTKCGWSNYHIDRYVKSFEFCPECGARMDEVSKDER